MEIWVCLFALAVGALMVSRIPYPHMVNQIFRGQRSFGHIVSVVFALGGDRDQPGLFDSDYMLGFRAGPAAATSFWQRSATSQHRKRTAVLTRCSSSAPACGYGRVQRIACSPDWSNPGDRGRICAEPPGVRLIHLRRHCRGRRGDRRQHRDQRLLPDRRRRRRRPAGISSRRGNAQPHEPRPAAARQPVNLERSLARRRSVSAAIFVTGHIDGLGTLAERRDDGDWSTFWFQAHRRIAAASRRQGFDRRRRREPDRGRRVATIASAWP